MEPNISAAEGRQVRLLPPLCVHCTLCERSFGLSLAEGMGWDGEWRLPNTHCNRREKADGILGSWEILREIADCPEMVHFG